MKKSTLAGMAAYGAAIGIAAGMTCSAFAAGPLGAASTGGYSSFDSMFGLPIVQTSTPLPTASLDTEAPSVRLRTVEQIAHDKGLTWEKVYHVSPATPDAPATTLEQAQRMVDQDGTVSMHVRGLPIDEAIRTVAAADGASVELSAPLEGRAINANVSDGSISQAIADLARYTHTHWSAQYVLGPPANPQPIVQATVSPAVPVAKGQQPTQAFNGPIMVRTAPSPEVPVAPVPAASATPPENRPNGAAPAQSRNGYGPEQTPYGYGAPYGYPYGYYNQERPYQVSPGLTIQPGNPYAGGGNIIFGG